MLSLRIFPLRDGACWGSTSLSRMEGRTSLVLFLSFLSFFKNSHSIAWRGMTPGGQNGSLACLLLQKAAASDVWCGVKWLDGNLLPYYFTLSSSLSLSTGGFNRVRNEGKERGDS